MSLPNIRIGYAPYKDRQEAEEAELNAWLSLPLHQRQEIVKKQSAEYDTKEKRASYIARLKKRYA